MILNHRTITVSNTVEPFDIPSINDIHLPGIFGKFEDIVDLHIAQLEKYNSKSGVIRTGFYKYLRKTVDPVAFAEIQRKYAIREVASSHLKYIDPIIWFGSKLNAAIRLGLDSSPPIKILDIGTGCGHFPTIARYFGHDVLGIDMPLVPLAAGQDTHIYNEMCAVYGVNKEDFKIEAFKSFELGKKFDLVTAFMAAFNLLPNRTPYTIDAWKFFFKNLHANVLNPGGFVMFSLTNGKVTEEVWSFLKSKSEWFDDKSLYLIIRDVESVFCD